MKGIDPDFIGRGLYQERGIFTFLDIVKNDPRIGTVHISLFLALSRCIDAQRMNPAIIFSTQVMAMAKISGVATYHKTIRQLHDYGYITYTPSCNHQIGSRVFILH